MKDIFGIEVKPGDFIIKSLNNRWFTLYKVVDIKKSIKCTRPRRKYVGYDINGGLKYSYEKVTSYVNPRTFVIVNPNPELVYLYNLDKFDAADEKLMQEHRIV